MTTVFYHFVSIIIIIVSMDSLHTFKLPYSELNGSSSHIVKDIY